MNGVNILSEKQKWRARDLVLESLALRLYRARARGSSLGPRGQVSHEPWEGAGSPRKGVWEQSRGRGLSSRGHSLSWSRSGRPSPLRRVQGHRRETEGVGEVSRKKKPSTAAAVAGSSS